MTSIFLLIAILSGWLATSAGSFSANTSTTTFDERVAAHNQIILSTHPDNRVAMDQTVLAFHRKLPLDERPLKELVDQVGPGSPNSDLAIVVLLRILFFVSKTNMADYYDKLILPGLQSEHYWYTTEDGVANDDTMNTENHMILWMSSTWLLQQKYGWDLKDATLRQRLIHYLNLKIEYGFYEFLSITYLPSSFNALLNLVDFCRDQEIKDLADLAIRRLVSDYLWFVNDLGVHYTAAGRDYAERFIAPPYTQDMDGIVYLISGLGALKREAMNMSSFLATSTIDLRPQAAQWQPSIDTTFRYGHTLQESFQINSKLGKYDRIVFQFSQGASQTAQVVVWGCNRRSYPYICPFTPVLHSNFRRLLSSFYRPGFHRFLQALWSYSLDTAHFVQWQAFAFAIWRCH
jgi:hypothetical protein